MFKQLAAMTGLVTSLAAFLPAHADTLLGVYAGAGSWRQDFAGEVASGGEQIDLDDLGIGDQANQVGYLAIEHGLPVLPNLRLGYSDLSASGREVLAGTLAFNGSSFAVGDNVASAVDVTEIDAVAYYQLLDNVVSLDLGVAARWVDGDVDVTSGTASGRARFEGVLPLAYARGRLDLPFSGWWIGAQAMGTGYHGHDLLDADAQLGWESPYGLGAELGWRTFRFELDRIDDIDHADIDVSGPYAAVNYHF